MSREIKFRVFESLNKNMHYLDFALYKHDEFNQQNNFVLPTDRQCTAKDYTIMNLDAVNIMQYTGLKDKNDKEIYEGDIVKVQYAFTVSDKSYNFKVCYDEDNAGFLLKEITKSCGTIEWFDNLSEHEFEVIGNIYENSELLNQ
ncbi:YopX family protein [Clostridium beijerinckii]|uniref:YopX protein domain-containing protein n=1 Tax=Clostridium beijerinckii TaxID=1520 RepID=A0A7X9XQ70_CLOBE|nr:YopX family protein [Clostridium beijerinckii]NMF06272.1 hypothetical protein [Clostridium beijerinckii]